MSTAEHKSLPRTMTGIVVSAGKMQQTITVKIESRKQHKLYGKYIRSSTKVHAHDEKNECNIGDVVVVRECRPLSKTKCWALVEIKERAA